MSEPAHGVPYHELQLKVRQLDAQLTVNQQLIDAQAKLIQMYQEVVQIHKGRIENLLK